MEEEKTYLDDHPVATRYRYDKKTGVLGAINIYEDGEAEIRERLSKTVVQERQAFYRECHKLVTREEVMEAIQSLNSENARLVAQGDVLWAGHETSKKNISDRHRHACIATGQERPWCYIPQQLVDCPGCGGKIKANVVVCSHCNALLSRNLDVYARMTREEIITELYPDRVEAATAPSGAGTGKK